MSGFRHTALELVRRFDGSKQDLARAIGIAPSKLSRFLNGQTVPDVGTCLLLASVTGSNPSAILRAAGHVEVAALIEAHYGTRRSPLAAAEAALLAQWRTVPIPCQKALRVLIARLAAPRPR